MTNVIIHSNANTTSLNKPRNPFTPLRCKSFHAKSLLKKALVDLIIGLFKVNFEKNPVKITLLNLMNGFRQNHHTLQNISSRKKRGLGGSNDLLSNIRNTISPHLGKNLKAHIERSEERRVGKECRL